jgi:hypothetical protein
MAAVRRAPRFAYAAAPLMHTLQPPPRFARIALPSTSPAHAIPRTAKLAPWRAALSAAQ